MEKWEKHCICKTPLNPDYMYIQCDVCKLWYHMECLGLSGEEADAMDSYICIECSEKGLVKPTENKEEIKSEEMTQSTSQQETTSIMEEERNERKDKIYNKGMTSTVDKENKEQPKLDGNKGRRSN